MTAIESRDHLVSNNSRYSPGPLAIVLATTAGLTVALAVALSYPQLMVFAAPMIGMVTMGRRAPRVHVTADVEGIESSSPLHCFESESIELHLKFAVTPTGSGTVMAARIHPVDGLVIDADADTDASLVIRVEAARWGLHPLSVEVTALIDGGLVDLRAHLDMGSLLVYPLPAQSYSPVPGASATMRVGPHTTRLRGSGMEFAGIREFVPGDDMRSVNWPATARCRRLQATERRNELANDIVVVIDETLPPTGPSSDALDRAVRGTTEVAWSALRAGDRVGLVCLGPRPRWYAARGGRQQFYGLATTLLDPADDLAVRFNGTIPPAAAIPAGATVVAFSSLLDATFAFALIKMRKSGHRVLVVDVLPQIPFPRTSDPLPEQLWSIERTAMYRDMGIVGVEVLRGEEADGIAATMHALSRVPEHARRR